MLRIWNSFVNVAQGSLDLNPDLSIYYRKLSVMCIVVILKMHILINLGFHKIMLIIWVVTNIY